MPILTIHYENENERLMLEQAIAYVSQLQKLALSAPVGTVLDTCEKLALDDGRKLLRSTLAAALQSRIVQGEQKGGSPSVSRSAPRTPQRTP
jgi:hypothetical protein